MTAIVGLVALGMTGVLGHTGTGDSNNTKLTDSSAYYANIDSSATNDVLKGQLQELIYPHTVLLYDDVWAAFTVIDQNLPYYPCDTNLTWIPDIYSDFCWEPIKEPSGGECGNYKAEGDCYNREHIWPKSWFGGFDYGDNAQTDLFELWPSDGYVNGLRGDLPLGTVVGGTATYTSTNGCVIGTCQDMLGQKCFEPTNDLKGDIARSYFYLSTCYWNKWSCCDTVASNGSDMKTWVENTMRAWHADDPVDEMEMARNDIIYSNYQGNRNPFIDNPQWVAQIDNF
jgi:endonuclease I